VIIDVVMGEYLNDCYIDTKYINRIEMDDITDYGTLVGLITSSLQEAFKQVPEVPEPISTIISEFSQLNAKLESGGTDDIVDEKIRELLSALALNNYEFYIIRRPDLDTTDINVDEVRAYMIDKQDSYFPALNRVVNGTSLTFTNDYDASLPTVIVQFLNEVKFMDSVEDMLQLHVFKEKYEKLEEAHMGYTLRTASIQRFLEDYGYKFIVLM